MSEKESNNAVLEVSSPSIGIQQTEEEWIQRNKVIEEGES